VSDKDKADKDCKSLSRLSLVKHRRAITLSHCVLKRLLFFQKVHSIKARRNEIHCI